MSPAPKTHIPVKPIRKSRMTGRWDLGPAGIFQNPRNLARLYKKLK